jgi:hypothetical protein
MWSYAACPNPRSTSLPDNCFTGGGCGPACWLDVSGATQSGANIFLDDTDAGLDKSVPAPAGYLLLSDAFKVFHLENAGFAGSCADKHGRSIPPALFRYDPKLPDRPGAPVLPLPHGVWIIDGSLKFDIGPNHDMPYCPAWWSGAELLVRGSATFGNRGYFFKPPPQLETVLVVGGDLALQSGVSLFSSCASGAAVVVREQAKLGGRNLLASPLVVTDTAHCMSEVLGETALELASPAGIEIDFPPVFNVFPVKSLAWSESAL